MESHKSTSRLIYLQIIKAVVLYVVMLYSLRSFNDILLQEKVIEYERHLKIICDRIDFNEDLGVSITENKQEEKLIDSISDLDSHPKIYAELFKYENRRFVSISNREQNDYHVKFTPFHYNGFMNDIMWNFTDRENSHTIEIFFEEENLPMLVSYRWTPREHENISYLLVTGISEETLDMEIPFIIYLIPTLNMVLTGVIAILVYLSVNKLIFSKTKESFYVGFVNSVVREGRRRNADK